MITNMAWKARGILAIFFISSSFLLKWAPAAELDNPVDLKADYLEYQKQNDLVYGRGNVNITSKDMNLSCDEIYLNVKEESLVAKGRVKGKDQNQEMRGEQLTYNLKTKEGVLSQGTVSVAGWICRGPELDRQGPDKMYLPKGYFTSCDLDEPHYRLKASRMSIYPGEKIICHNVFFIIGDLPIFYFPVYYQSLSKKKYDINVMVGHTSTEGNFVKTYIGYPLTDHTYGRLYIDYMQYLGWGEGAQYDYNFPNLMNGSIYYYYMHQRARTDPPVVPEETRKNFTFNHWEKIGKEWTVQANANYVTDQTFNSLINEDNVRQISNDITSYLAFSKLNPFYTFRMLGQRHDIWDVNAQAYKPDYVYAPQVTFATNQLRLPWSYSRRAPLYFSYSLDTKRAYTQALGFYDWDGNTQMALTNRLNLTRAMSLTPRIGVTEFWQDKISELDPRTLLQTQYFTNVNLRTRLTQNLDWDLSHVYTEEINARSVLPRGVLANKVTTAFELRLSRRGERTQTPPPTMTEASYTLLPGQTPNLVQLSSATVQGAYGVTQSTVTVATAPAYSATQLLRFRTSTGYNLIHNGYYPVNRKERYDNILNALTVTPASWISLNLTEEYSVIFHNTQRVATDFRFWQKRYDAAVLTTYLKSDPGKLDVQNDTGFWLTKNWKVNLHLRYTLFNDKIRIMQTQITERSVLLYRDLHCWEVQFSWSKLPLDEQVWLRFNLKILPVEKLGVFHDQRVNGDFLEEEWNFRRQ